MNENSNLTPKIRFKGFTDAWEQRKVSELFRITRGYVLAATQTETEKTDEKPYPVYSSQTKDKGLMGYYKDYLYEDAITWTTDGANAGTVNYRAGKFYCTNVCGVLLSNEVKANQMIAEALNNVAKGYVSYVGNPKLMNNVMADIVIQMPTQIEEREQLSLLFANLDNLITLHQRKYDKLVKIKSSLLEKMFPKNFSNIPEVRFKGFTDAWEQRKLKDVSIYIDGNYGESYPKYNEFIDSGIPFFTSAVIGTTGIFDYKLVKYISKEKNDTLIKAQSHGGDIILTNRGASMGTSSQIPLKYGLVNIGPQLTRIRSIKGEADNSFLLSMLKVPFNKDRLLSMNAGSAMPFIGLAGLGTFTFNSPNLSEQSKIGLLFQNIDNLITLHQLN